MTSDAAHELAPPSAMADWATLLKLRIASFVGFSAFVGARLGSPIDYDWARCFEAAVWVTLAAGAASVFNQVFERDTDRLMVRTRARPVAAGRIVTRDALLFGGVLAVLAIAMLAWRFNVLSAVLAFTTLFAYVAVYTPLKRASTLNTYVGALPGAAPPLLGYAALAGVVDGWAWILFAIVFVWQFPHFMAIAWLYRDDYARAGLRMLPAQAGCEPLAGRTALSHSLVLWPIAMVPLFAGDASWRFALPAMLAGAVYVAASARFAWRQDRIGARVLLYVSLAYLPLVLTAALLDPQALWSQSAR